MKRRLFAALVLTLLAGGVGYAHAQVITVNTGDDVIDIDPETATVEDLPGPDGKVSFSEAMIAANHTPGPQTIGFAVPQDEWQMQWLYPGRAVISTSFPYFTAFGQVTIDGTTQTAFTGDTNPDGAEVVLVHAAPGLLLYADDCVVRGLDSTPISVNASRAHIVDNTQIGVEFYGGSGSVVQNNTGGFLKLDQSNDNVVIGNTFLQLRLWGWFAGGRPATNNRIGGPSPSDRNYFLGTGTWSSQGIPGGFAVQLFDTDGTILENNSIGTTPDGLAQGSAAAIIGVYIQSKNTNVVVRNNRIAGILAFAQPPHGPGWFIGSAIQITGEGERFDIVGNTIGLNANGDPDLGSVYGIEVGTWFSPSLVNVKIGGPNAGDGNTIAGHLSNGIVVGREVQGARISGNSIYGNDMIGIDLVTSGSIYGVTPNDPLDPDEGGNGLQNFPEIRSATSNGSSVHVAGTLQSEASTQYRIEFFASPSCDSSGYGEGQVYLDATSVTTDVAGNAAFDVTLAAAVDVGWVLTSTATRESTGATSEFSPCQVIDSGGPTGLEDVSIEPLMRLEPASPNPFQTATTLRYELPREAIVSLSIYDVGGRLIRALADGNQRAGKHEVAWSGVDTGGRSVVAGVYFVRFWADGQTLTRRIMVVR